MLLKCIHKSHASEKQWKVQRETLHIYAGKCKAVRTNRLCSIIDTSINLTLKGRKKINKDIHHKENTLLKKKHFKLKYPSLTFEQQPKWKEHSACPLLHCCSSAVLLRPLQVRTKLRSPTRHRSGCSSTFSIRGKRVCTRALTCSVRYWPFQFNTT